MFDSNLCSRELKKIAVYSESWSIEWLNKPLGITILLILAVFTTLWIRNNPHRIRWPKSPKEFLFLFLISASFSILVFLFTQGFVPLLPRDSGKPVDAIVVLGRGWFLLPSRVDAAADLWQAKRAPRIFTSGINDAPQLIKRLENKGIPQRLLDGENCSLTTEENAIFTAAVLQPQGVRKILLVTDRPHMLRAFFVFRAYGFKVTPITTSVAEDWNPKTKIILKLREYAGIMNYAFRGLFIQRHFSAVDNAELKNLVQEAEKYGRKQRL